MIQIIKLLKLLKTIEPTLNTLQQPRLTSSVYGPTQTYASKRYLKTFKKPEEELAELEAEFAEEEKKKNKKFERLDFSAEGGDEYIKKMWLEEENGMP